MTTVTFADIATARERIRGGVLETPCTLSPMLSEQFGSEIWCKMEYLQRTGSFKERGARNALLLMTSEERARGVIAASAGNHALALAWHGSSLGSPVTVVMPRYAPLVKQANCRKYGAKVILHGDSFAEAKAKADEISAAEGQRYVHGYDDPAIIAGAGTLGIEILEQCPEADAILVPVGGGGLIAGVSVAVKHLRQRTEIIGVESVASQCFGTALAAGHPVKVESQPTLADGLAVSLAGDLALSLARPRLDRFVHVTEAELALGVVRMMEWEKAVVEGAGAAPLAAFLSGKLLELRGKRVVLLLGGGNIDLPTLPRLIDSALVADGRLARFTVVISDRPGGLAKLAQLIADVGVSVKEIEHDREFCGPTIAAVQVRCTVESRDAEHVNELYRALTRAGFEHFSHEGR